jgi:hypothetical protein
MNTLQNRIDKAQQARSEARFQALQDARFGYDGNSTSIATYVLWALFIVTIIVCTYGATLLF